MSPGPMPRRRTLAWLGVVLAASACAPVACSPEERQRQARLRSALCLPPDDPRFDLGGLGLVFDAMAGEEFFAAEFYADDGVRPFFAKARLTLENESRMGVDIQRLPMRVRVVWRKTDSVGFGVPWGDALHHFDNFGVPSGYNPNLAQLAAQDPWTPEKEIAKRKLIMAARGVTPRGPWGSDYGDEILGDHTIAVADRIPREAYDTLCKDGGGMSLRFRLHKDGVFMGWEVGRPALPDEPLGPDGLKPEGTVMHGGDFRPARIYNGRPVRRGWYIDPKTGQKIETDF